MNYENVAIDTLAPHPDNPRIGNLSTIKDSIEQNGFYGAVVAQVSTRHILTGNHRVQALKELGRSEVPVLWIDCDDARAKQIMLADNRSSDVATYDDSKLLELLDSLPSLNGTGYDADDLNDLLASVQEMPTPDYTTTPSTGTTAGASEPTIVSTNSTNYEPSYAEQMSGYSAKGVRSIILDFEIDDFQDVITKAERVRTALGVITNADLFRRLVDDKATELDD